MDSSIAPFCWVLDVSKEPVEIRVDTVNGNTGTVGDLVVAIKKDMLVAVANVELALWKPNEPVYINDMLGEHIQLLGTDLTSFAVELSLSATLSSIFPGGPMENCVDILAQVLRAAVIPAKRLATPEQSEYKRLKIAHMAPSLAAKLSNYVAIQGKSSERILDGRPESNTNATPITLLYEGFGQFLDNYGRKDGFGISPMRQRDLESRVDDFAVRMNQFYSNEADRRTAILQNLNDIFHVTLHDGSPIPLIQPMVVDGRTVSDGHIIGAHGAISCIVEFKNEICNISSIPHFEMMGYVAHSFKLASTQFEGWRVPCLGLTIVGPYITFYAVILAGQYHAVELTRLSSVSQTDNIGGWQPLHSAFFAALVLIARLLKDTRSIVDNSPPRLHRSVLPLPCVSSLRTYGGRASSLNFKLVKRLQESPLLYLAITTDEDKKEIVVKFTK